MQKKPSFFKSLIYVCASFMYYMYFPSSFPGLVMRGATSYPLGEPLGKPDTYLETQPNYRFTRQPVKYHRHQNPGTHLSDPGHSARESVAPVRGCPGSADSSHSSSPEPKTQRHFQNLDGCCQNTFQATGATESKVDVALSPREVVQYMLGLDSTFTSPATATTSGIRQKSSQDEAPACQVNRQNDGQSRTLSQSPKTLTAEHNLTSPAQKILSGLKLRRSHSGKDEQLFVWEMIDTNWKTLISLLLCVITATIKTLFHTEMFPLWCKIYSSWRLFAYQTGRRFKFTFKLLLRNMFEKFRPNASNSLINH